MTEVAALQMNVESSSVLRAANDLDTFSAAAKRAGAAAGLNSGSIGKIVAAMQSMDAKLGTIVSSLDRMSKASQGVAAANDNVARALGVADSHVIAYTQHLAALAAQQQQANAHVVAWQQSLAVQASATADSNAHIIAYRNSLGQVEDSAKKASAAIKFTAQDGLNASRQLADIGVTAAMGMSPFMIAIQQGPQLLDILQNKAAVTEQTLGSVFRAAAAEVWAFLLPFTPLIVAAGLLAAAIAAITRQANDDSGLKKYTTAMGYTKEEVKKLNAVTVTWGDTFKAVFQVGFERIVNAFGLSTADLKSGWNAFLDWMADASRATIAGIYAAFTGGFYAIKVAMDNVRKGEQANPFETLVQGYKDAYADAQGFMDDVVKQARKNAQDRQAEMAKAMYDKPAAGAHKYDFGDLLKEAQKMENDLTKARAQIGLYGEALARVTYEQDLFNKASEHGLKLNPQQIAQIKSLAAAMAVLAEANRVAVFREDTRQQFMQQWQGLKDVSAQIGVYGRDLSALRYEQEALNRAIQQHITLTENDREVIRSAAEALADKEYANIRAKVAADNAKAHAENMRQLDVERGALNLTGKELIAYNYQQDLINKALQAGVAFKDVDIEKTRRQAEAYAEARYAIDQQAQAIADAREVTKGFFSDWINGVREGGNLFKTFADSVINSLNRIIDKLLDKTLNGFLDSMFSGGGGALSGLFGGSSSNSSSGLVSTGDSAKDWTSIISGTKWANGGVFHQAQRFANGGAFTNSIVTSPTLFRFANGGALGEMGEAGPEAIMPLKRGANGSLGVQVHGGNSKPSVRMGDYNPTFQFAGAVGLDGIAQLVRQGGQETYDQMKRDLQTLLQQLDVDGTFAT